MTSRLKRKLVDLGVDPSSSKANESFCLIGTPLPPLEKSKDTGEFVPLWKQEVRDEKGRRRLHGAFTGGFSAGYFNTVGSKEGALQLYDPPAGLVTENEVQDGLLKPLFLSVDRSKQKKARPEDFMDEEDLAEIAASRTVVDTTEEMNLIGGTQAELGQRGDDDDEAASMARKLEQSLLPAPKDSVGARILKKMGWRVGQGIGPRLTLRQRLAQDALYAAGAAGAVDNAEGEEDADEAGKHTYAPRDTPLLLAPRKDNSHGLGYRPGMGLSESVGAKAGGAPDGPRLAAGFGLGALNDADDDDVDVYDSNANRGRTRMAYDIADREDDETIVIGGHSAKKAGPSTTPDTRSSLSSAGTFRDGTQVLPGFILSDQPVSEDKWFPLPDIPKGWKPDPRRVWDKDKENVGRRTTPPPQSHGKWKEGISADKRGSLLGETPLPAAPKSVFEYMSQKDRERLQSLASQRLEPPNRPTPTAPSAPPPIAASIPPPGALAFPRTEPHVATAALHGFQPFTTNPDKQARYTAYLRSQAAPAGATPPPPPPPRALPGQSAAEYHKELADYAKSAAVFKPLSAAMAGRFTSAAVVEYGPTAQEGLHTPSFVSAGTEGGDADAATKEEAVQKAEEKEEDPKTNAARLGMYGPLTREVKVWKPARLLCKRFGVKDPHPEPVADDADAGPSSAYAPPTAAAAASTSTVPAESLPGPGGLSAADAWALAELTGDGTGAGDERAGVGVARGGRRRRDFANVGLGEDESQARDVLTYERPSMDVFKAIFASDDEDDGSDDEDDVPPAVEAKAPGAGGVR